MSPRNSELRDALHAELAFHQAEFNALRSEIVQWLEAERQYLNLCLVAIAAGLGAFPFIVQQKAFVVLLLFPFIFSCNIDGNAQYNTSVLRFGKLSP